MALNYGDNYVYKVKKGSTEYNVKDAVAAEAIEKLNANASTEGSVAKAVADAQTALKGTKAEGDTTAETIRGAKDYADELISGLDASESQTAGTDGLALSITEVDGVITGISGSIAANTYDAHGAAATAKSEVIGTSTDAGTADTINGAKKYAKGLVDTVLGEDSASTTLASLKAVIAELNDPANAGGITGTFVDTVKSDLNGLTKVTYYTAEDEDEDPNHIAGSVKDAAAHATVKEYVDNAKAEAIASANSSATSTIANGILTLGI